MTEDQLAFSFNLIRLGIWSSLYYRITEGLIVQLLIAWYYTKPIDAIFIFFRVFIWVGLPLWMASLLLFQVSGFAESSCSGGKLWLREFFMIPNLPFDQKSCGWEFHFNSIQITNSMVHILSYVVLEELKRHLKLQVNKAKFFLATSAAFGLGCVGCMGYVLLQGDSSFASVEDYFKHQETGIFLHFLGAFLGTVLLKNGELTAFGKRFQQLFHNDWIGDCSVIFGLGLMLSLQNMVDIETEETQIQSVGKFLITMVVYIIILLFLTLLFALECPRLLLKLQSVRILSDAGKTPNFLFLITKICILKNVSIFQAIKFGPYTVLISIVATVAVLTEAFTVFGVFVFLFKDLLLFFEHKQLAVLLQLRKKTGKKTQRETSG